MVEMKDSGLRWVGKIPNHWNVKRIKFLANDEENSFVDGDWIESPCITNSGIRYYTSGNVGDGEFKEQGDGYITEETFDVLNCKFAYPGDLVFSRLNAPYGRSCILPDTEPCCVLAVDNVILRTDQNKKFITYVTQCEGYHLEADVQAVGTAMRRISRTNLGKIKLPIPPLEEQQQIVTYLNARCAKIDGAVAQRKSIIEKLKEYKTAVITKAVTKGLNLDVEMKDSGIDWIGEIPNSSIVTRVKYCANIILGKMIQPNQVYSNETLESYLCSVNIKWNGVDTSIEKKMWFSDKEKEIYKLIDNDVLVTEGGSIGVSALYNNEFSPCYFQNSIMCLRSYPSKVLSRFLYYWMYFSVHCGYVESVCNKATITHYPKIKLSNTPIVCHSLEVQHLIVSYLDSQCTKIDEAISKQEQLIAKLEEYRKSIIYYAVTGKIDCRKGV